MLNKNIELKNYIRERSFNKPTLLTNNEDVKNWMKAVEVLNDLVSDNDQSENIEDINAMIGYYLDNIEFSNKDIRIEYVISSLKSIIDDCRQFCLKNDMEFVLNNFQSLIEFKIDNAIFKYR